MAFTVQDLKLPAEKIAQIEKALGGDPDDAAAPELQVLCDAAAADVTRLTTGYVMDDASIENFTRAIALFRAHGQIGPVPEDMQKNFDNAWEELKEISQGKRPNLQKANSTEGQQASAGSWGSKDKVSGI
jgi:hypothetical protein